MFQQKEKLQGIASGLHVPLPRLAWALSWPQTCRFGPKGTHVCSEHVRLCACHLWSPPCPVRRRACGWRFWPRHLEMLSKVPSEKDLIWVWLLYCVLSPTMGRRPLSPGQPAGHGSSHFWSWVVCMSECGAHLLLQLKPRICLLSHQGWPQNAKMATRFSVASPVENGDPLLQAVGSCAQPLLEWHSQRSWLGAWHRNPTCFVSGISWRAGHVAMCVRPERDPRAPPGRVLLARSLPASFALGMTSPEQA